MPFSAARLDIPEVILIEPALFGDERGLFLETYRASDFGKMGIGHHFVQDNQSRSKRNVLRGLHYQLQPKAQGKLVRVVRGAVFDVAVDMRKGSPHRGKWVGLVLSEENRRMLWIPPGFAHGFIATEDETEVLYKVTEEYAPALDRGILWNDPELNIVWPVAEPILSPKDAHHPSFRDAENNFVYED